MHKKLAIIGCGELGIQIQNIAKSDDHFEDVIFFDDFVKSNTENKYNIVGKTNEILSSYKKDWSWEEMNGFLLKPAKWIKGNKMGFAGIKDEKERASVILYLNKNSDSPKDLP